MKTKYFIFAASALVALASCSSDEYVGDNSPTLGQGDGSIQFGSGFKAVTRADKTGAEAAGLLDNNFIVAGTKGESPTTFVFDQYKVKYVANTANTTESNTANWEYVSFDPASTTTLTPGTKQTIKYWDYSTTQYDFAAYSLGKGYDHDSDPATDPQYATASPIAAGNKSYTLQGSADALKACYISDLVTAYNRDAVNDYGNVVQLKFRSLGTKIRLAFYETVPGYSVKEVKFYTAAAPTTLAGDATDNTARVFAGTSVLPTGSGTMTITFPTTGWANKENTDYNKAHIAFTPTTPGEDLSTQLQLGALADMAAREEKEATGNIYLGRASNAATYAGGLDGGSGKYYTILPYETGANLTLRIKYTLVSTDGSGENITVDNATAVVPAEYTKWQPNYAYTYIFKISDYTNGTTGVDGNGDPVYGLTPITFDAVVIDSQDGLQETITTVSDPSITTYAKGNVVTTNNEYKVSNNIYVAVNNGTNNEVLTNKVWLYTTTIEDGAAQGISEASVDNALANGAYDKTAGTFTVTDANGKKLVVTLTNLLSIINAIPASDSPNGNAISFGDNKLGKFTPATAGTYVLRFETDAPIYDSGTVLESGTSLKGYYTDVAGVKTRCNDSDTADGTTTYYKVTTPGKYMYKIIKVVD